MFQIEVQFSLMRHTYHFNIFPRSEVVSYCIFSYASEQVIPNDAIEKIARSILTHAKLLWLQGQEQCLNTRLNLETLKSVLKDQEDNALLEWLAPFETLLIHNDKDFPSPDNATIVIKLE